MHTAELDAPSAQVSRVWWVVAVAAALTSAYALSYLVLRADMFPDQLAASFLARPWGIYPHAFFGAVALFAGALQFRRSLLVTRPGLHRRIGIAYVASAVLAGAAGAYMAGYSFGGWITHAGFGLLGVLVIATTAAAFLSIKRWDVAAHRAWMLRSYALLFAAVTLRVELPLLMIAFAGDFTPAYQLVSWLCWVPNLAWAEWHLRRSAAAEAPFLARLESGA